MPVVEQQMVLHGSPERAGRDDGLALPGKGHAMILGVGTDLIDIRRIERTLERFGSRFSNRVFTPIEQQKAARRSNPAAAYAQRYAAKEACAKALGTGFSRGVFWRDIGVENWPSGQPFLMLTGGAERRLMELVPSGWVPRLDLSLTDEPPFAHGMVIISAERATDDALRNSCC